MNPVNVTIILYTPKVAIEKSLHTYNRGIFMYISRIKDTTFYEHNYTVIFMEAGYNR